MKKYSFEADTIFPDSKTFVDAVFERPDIFDLNSRIFAGELLNLALEQMRREELQNDNAL